MTDQFLTSVWEEVGLWLGIRCLPGSRFLPHYRSCEIEDYPPWWLHFRGGFPGPQESWWATKLVYKRISTFQRKKELESFLM